jgi:protein TonB
MSEFFWSRQAFHAGTSMIDVLVLALATLVLGAGALAAWRAWTTAPLVIRWWEPVPDRLEAANEPYGAKAMIRGYPDAMRTGVSSAGTIHILLAILGVIFLALPRPAVVEDPTRDTVRVLPRPFPPPRIIPEGEGGGSSRPIALPDPRNAIPVPTDSNVRTLDPEELIMPMEGTEDGSIWDRGPIGDGSERDPGWPAGGPTGLNALADPGPNDFVPVEQLPELVWMAEPRYPEMARLGGLEGTVELLLLVNIDGRVKTARVERSIVGLDEAALAAAMTATFKPALWQGKPVKVWVALPIRFSLR